MRPRLHLDRPMLAALGLDPDDDGKVDRQEAAERAARLVRRPYGITQITLDLLVDVVTGVQEALWIDRPIILRTRAQEALRDVRLPDGLADVAAVALDVGLGNTTVRAGCSFAESIGAMRRPIRERLEEYARQLIQAAAEAGEITLSKPIPPPPRRPPS